MTKTKTIKADIEDATMTPQEAAQDVAEALARNPGAMHLNLYRDQAAALGIGKAAARANGMWNGGASGHMGRTVWIYDEDANGRPAICTDAKMPQVEATSGTTYKRA